VVFGDIGTSPLYAIQSVFTVDNQAVHVTRGTVYGVISLVFWSLTMIVSVKYVTFVMRAEDRGEGGIMALTALLKGARLKRGGLQVALVTLGVVGASLFYGDSAITPAISVLSAVEGLKVPVPSLGSIVLPITAAVLCALFAIQRFGTRLVGNLFGPVMAVWFGVLATVGGVEIARHPGILRALSPTYGAQFLLEHGSVAFVALGALVLVVTGAEALYADMGHFGPGALRRAWFFVVFPALTLNYLGQGSLILRSPKSVANPFFLLLPGWARIPMVFLATVATVIASQAVISGAFSVSQQAVQLGFLPRLKIQHTSQREVGQIYVPAINAGMLAAVLGIVIGFGSATALASAYGVAVTGTFVLTTILFLAVARLLWRKRALLVALGGAVLLTVELAFFAANVSKIEHGGWLPLAIATIVCTTLMTWHRGREIVTANRSTAEGSFPDFLEQLSGAEFPIQHVPGVAVFLHRNLGATPLALRANVEHNHVLHDQVIIVSIHTERVPHIPDSERVVAPTRNLYSAATGDPLHHAAERITPVTLRFGFLDAPDVPSALRLAIKTHHIAGEPDLEQATYFLSQITIVLTDAAGMAAWRKKLFVTMARNAAGAAEYFSLPDGRTFSTSGRIHL
jgi:KUP system potassium uptake protein